MAQGAALLTSSAAPAATFPLVEKLRPYLVLSQAEIEFLGDLHEPKRKLARHREIIVAGRPYDHLFMLCSGVVSRYKVLPVQPPETIGWPEDKLAELVTKESMIGVARLEAPYR